MSLIFMHLISLILLSVLHLLLLFLKFGSVGPSFLVVDGPSDLLFIIYPPSILLAALTVVGVTS